MEKRSKNHHFVPQVLQRQFTDGGDQIWYAEKNTDGQYKRPACQNIKKVFSEKNGYTVIVDDNPSDVVERKFYGAIDGYLGVMFKEVNEAFLRNETPVFSGESLRSLREVVLAMTKRTPEFVKEFDDEATGREVLEKTLRAGKEQKIGTEDEYKEIIDKLSNTDRLKEYGRSIRVRATIARSERLERALEGFSVRWAVSETRHSFVLSSLVVYRIGNGGSNGLKNPNMEFWMPIAPKIALVLLRDPENKIGVRNVVNSRQIRKVNEYAAHSSRCIASGSKKLMESLTGKKALIF